MAFGRENLFSDLVSVLVISFSFIDLNEDVRSKYVCVCVLGLLLMGPVCAPNPPLPMPHDPRKAEWQGSG